MKNEKEIVTELAAQAGIAVNGKDPWDIQVHNEGFYARVLKNPYLGLGESYMDGWWGCERLDEFFSRVLRANLDDRLKNWTMAAHYVKAALFNHQTRSRARKVARQHYDIGNELYKRMLGRTMAYSCGYWKDAKDLDAAQEAKFDLICRKIGLEPGMKVLDLGCGFGTFLKYAAERYGASGVGVTISKEQIRFARETAKGLPLEFQLIDYREAKGTFDRVVSVGAVEHVGYKNYRTFFGVAKERLADDGLFLLHTIGSNTSTTIADPWTNRYIFPNGNLPSIRQFGEAMERTFVMEDWHNFGAYYDPTLMAWHKNFAGAWPDIKHDYDDRFYRMWTYYLLSCAGSFRARNIELWQLVLSKKGVAGGYRSVR